MPSLKPSLKVRAAAELELRRRLRESETKEPPLWEPYPETEDNHFWSPQLRAIESLADITGFGGQAGGGKTDLAIGLAATRHKNSIIFRRKYKNLKAIIRRTRQIFKGKGKFNASDLAWRDLPGGRSIEFGAVEHEHDVENFRGNPHDLYVFDEATGFLESQIWFLIGWLRDTDPNQRCRVVLTFNPPRNSDEQWVKKMFAAWLDREHPNPAKPGEIRWYSRVDGVEVECENGEPFEHVDESGRVEQIQPMSRTFFPSRLVDNPLLSRTNYRATLQMLPEPLRSQVLYGDFDAGSQDDDWQIIPSSWIAASVKRWKAAGGDNKDWRGFSPDVIAQDVAQGGNDKTVNARRFGHFVPSLDKHSGKSTPDGHSAAATAAAWHSGTSVIYVDATGGHGGSSLDQLRYPEPYGFGLGESCYGINFSGSSEYKDRSGHLQMANLRAEMYYRLYQALDPEQPGGSDWCLPDDTELIEELAAMRYKIRGDKYYIEPKEDIASRIGRSPDAADAVAMLTLPIPDDPNRGPSMKSIANPAAGNRGSKRRKY